MTDQEIISIAREAYIYALPLVISDCTFKSVPDESAEIGSTINQLVHTRTAASPEDKSGVRQNIDVLSSTACINLIDEPLMLTIPAMQRCCSVALYDAYANCRAILGADHANADKSVDYLLCGPDYKGFLPRKSTQIVLPTYMTRMIVRIAYEDEDDLANAIDIQNRFSLLPLSEYLNPYYEPPPEPTNGKSGPPPYIKVQEMDIETFFNAFNELTTINPATAEDEPVLEDFKTIGVGLGQTFSLSHFSLEVQEALGKFPQTMIGNLIHSSQRTDKGYFHLVNGWLYTSSNIARYGTDYEFRAVIALTEPGACPSEIAICPSTQADSNEEPLDGANTYVLHFEADELPPCREFWSLAAYDSFGFLIKNPLDKYTVRSKDDLVRGDDGSIDIYLQAETPGEDLEANWLPIGSEPFQLMLRIYMPEESVVNLEWKPPAVTKV